MEYSKGDIVYITRYINNLDIEEVVQLKLRTIKKDYMVGCTEKSSVFLLGKDMIGNIFSTSKEAKAHLKDIVKSQPKKARSKSDIPEQLYDEYEKEEEE